MTLETTLEIIGAGCFGLVVGWICYRTLRRVMDAQLSDLASVIGVIGGGVVVALFQTPRLFASYSIGLAIGFFAYLIVASRFERVDVIQWMGTKPRDSGIV